MQAEGAVPAAAAAEAEAAAPAPQHSFPKAIVRAPPGDDKLVVTVTLGAKTCNLNRPNDEPLEKALARLAKNLTAKPAKKDKRKKGVGSASAASSGADASTDEPGGGGAALYEDAEGSRPLPGSLPNGEAWRRGAVLQVAGERFRVDFNPPAVDRLSLERLAMVGFPTAAVATVANADPSACRWRWFARRPGAGGGGGGGGGGSDSEGGGGGGPEGSGWVQLPCASPLYTPRPEDEGALLRVECTPVAEGAAEGAAVGEPAYATTGSVQAGPAACSATLRCGAGPPPPPAAPPAFRILSYNLLADQYAGSTYAQEVLFGYCPRECLDPAYRRALAARELLAHGADVLCLQEVDERAFTDCLTPILGAAGYAGHYTNKQGKVREGSATFWRAARFTALGHLDVRLRAAFAAPLPARHAQFAPLLAASPDLADALQRVTTVAQATLLAPRSGHAAEGCLCVANTHLFFHPYAPHIRTMHTAAILEEVAAWLDAGAAGDGAANAASSGSGSDGSSSSSDGAANGSGDGSGGGGAGEALRAALAASGRPRPAVLLCGDLNSDLNDGIPGVVELLRSGRLAADYWDWVQGAAFKWGMGEEDGEAMAQATAQIAAAAAAGSAAAASPADGAGSSPQPQPQPGSTAAAVASLFAPDGHAFDDGAASAASAATAAADAAASPSGGGRSSSTGGSAGPDHPIRVTGVDITLPYVLRSADDLATPYTNYTSGYKALLDYVWYEEWALRVVRSAPMPSPEQLAGFIPSREFPSDHLAVVYDLEWKPQAQPQ